MSRTGVQSSASLKVKTVTNSATNIYKFVSLILVAVSATVAFITLRKPIEASGDPGQFTMKKMPEEYTRLEYTDPEDRDVFHGFKTSFIPQEEIRLANNRVKRRADVDDELYESNDTDFWWLVPESYQSNRYSRVKRRSEDETLTTDEYWTNEDKLNFDDKNRDLPYDEFVTQGTDKNINDDNRSIEAVIRSNMHVDRGPLDDVVEQMRGQPELEEGEMGISAHIYKPARSYTVMHAFWKGQGDRETIRRTQSHIMKQYMDEEADPCQDFYQYACGNWAALNPIPADKAGYDTFEILRENLDAVLKDLLEFKPNEKISTNYPGPHLDLNEHFVTGISFPDKSLDWNRNSSNVHTKKTDLINRIRRYLDRKTSQFLRPLKKIKKSRSKQKQNKKKYQTKIRKKRLTKFKSGSNRNKKNDVIVSFKTSNKIFKREVQNATVNQKKDTANADVANGDAALKARYLFKSCMNYEILKRRGHQPLLDLLKLLGGWPILDPDWDGNNFDWLELMAKLRLYNNDILISEWVGPDIKNSDEFVIQFDQTSLGLPSREYFLLDCNKPYLEAYKLYLIKIALLLGGEPTHVNKSAADLIHFEKRLAKITSTPEDRRNVSELYRRMSIAKLEELVPQVKWRRYLCVVMNRTVKPEETVVLFALSYVQHLVSLIEETEVNTLSNYLMWRFVRHRVNNLDDRFQAAKQQFYFVLFGREQAPPRWKNCISQVNSNMGMALGSMFVRKYFDETSKNDTLTMTREIQQSFRELLHLTDWIDDETKKLAAHKVDAMMLRIGYPDFILNKEELDDRYKEVLIHPDKYFENILNILQHLTKMEQARLGQPVNKTLWNTAPAVVNAYYSRNKNQIMFPAGILQPPFYHRHFPRSLNYGGIGVVIGHEITHGFDDKGRLFDCDGNLHRWWSDSAIGSFHLRAQCLIDQYGRYVVPEVNMKLDGVNTQGENIADNGGVKQAFRAYLHWLQLHGSEGETLPGLNHTHKQLFFLNFAQVWCGAMRPEAMRNKLKTAVHSPGRFRVIGTLSNSRDFAREFHCPIGSPMNPEEKCSVW